MPRSTWRNDKPWSSSPNNSCVLEESPNAPLAQFYLLYTHQIMQKAKESQAPIKDLDFN